MKFYQVKREADNKKLDKNWNIFVGGELFTEKEMEKYGRRWANRNNVNRGAEIEYCITPFSNAAIYHKPNKRTIT